MVLFREESLEKVEDLILLDNLMRDLSDVARQVVVLHYYSEMTLHAIAEKISCSLDFVKETLSLAIEFMHSKIVIN